MLDFVDAVFFIPVSNHINSHHFHPQRSHIANSIRIQDLLTAKEQVCLQQSNRIQQLKKEIFNRKRDEDRSKYPLAAFALRTAFDQCPQALFSFLTDKEASCVARAVCIPRFLTLKCYDIKSELYFKRVLSTGYTGVVRRLCYNVTGNHIANVPSTVQSMVVLGSEAMKNWRADSFPRSLTSLTIDDTDFVEKYRFRSRPSSRFELPPHLTKLTWRALDTVSAKKLSALPQSLTSLSLTGSLDEDAFVEVTLSLPPLLKHLELGDVAFQSIESLPSSLEELRLSQQVDYKHELRHATLRRLQLPENYPHVVRACDFPSLQQLHVFHNQQPLDDLPASLTDLTVDGHNPVLQQDLSRLPSSLQKLTLRGSFNQPLNHLPATLKVLRFDQFSEFTQPLDDLPPALEELHLPAWFNHPLDRLPQSLRILTFERDGNFNHPLNNLPNSLTELRLGSAFDQPLQRLPLNLTTLDLSGGFFNGSCFNQPLPLTPSQTQDASYSYPKQLRSLHLGHAFDQPLTLPSSLTSLFIAARSNFAYPLSVSDLPEGLLHLYAPYLNMEEVRKRCPSVTTE